jgi:hypothetical protein
MGDFVGLDDLFTEHPRVVDGMIEIFGSVDRRVRHRRLPHRHGAPRQSGILAGLRAGHAARAKARGIPNFHIFGEVFDPDPGTLARFTKVDGFPAVLDFAFQSAVTDVVARPRRPSGWPAVPGRRALRGRRGDGQHAAHLPWQSRHGPLRPFRPQGESERLGRGVLKRVLLGHA